MIGCRSLAPATGTTSSTPSMPLGRSCCSRWMTWRTPGPSWRPPGSSWSGRQRLTAPGRGCMPAHRTATCTPSRAAGRPSELASVPVSPWVLRATDRRQGSQGAQGCQGMDIPLIAEAAFLLVAAQSGEVGFWQPVALGVVGEPPLRAAGLDRALAQPPEERMAVPLAPDQRPQIARCGIQGDQPDARAIRDGPVGAEEDEPVRGTAES